MKRTVARSILLLTILTAAEMFLNAGYAACSPQKVALQNKRVVVRGKLAGSSGTLQVTIWQTANPKFPSAPYAIAHLAIETDEPNPRQLWQTDGGDSRYEVDSIELVNLDNSGVPFISSLWWEGASAGAELRVFHWDKEKDTFVEISSRDDMRGIYSYKIKKMPPGPDRLIIYVRPPSSQRRAASKEYELREGKLIRVGGTKK
jgi:hypothetical protein